MDTVGIEGALRAAESAVESGQGLEGTGFWGAVSLVKANPELAERYGPQIAAIDQAAFRGWALLVVPIGLGNVLALLATVAGLVMIGWAYSLEGVAAAIVFFIGVGVLMVTTHGLAHLLVGAIFGIRFTSWFVGSMRRPQPGLKVDYDSYLRATPIGRASMHAAGAVVTKLVPLAMIGAAIAADLPDWSVWALVALTVIAIITDVLWSTRSSDWKRFLRELRFAQSD